MRITKMRITSNFYTKSLILRAKTTSSATTSTLNFLNSLKYSFDLFLIIRLVLISRNSGSKRFKISTL